MNRVVVGLDGSVASRHALKVALDEARWRNQSLLAVTAWHPPMVSTPYPIAIDPHEYERSAESRLDDALSELSDEARATVKIETRVAAGDARDVLLTDLDATDLLVVGTRGLGGVMGLLLGSVASHCIRHAPCPVLVVPADAKPTS